MHVLDVGSGAGDVAILAADLVGPSGTVVGADVSTTALAHAKKRTEALGLSHVSFRHGDPTEIEFDKPFDVIVGRYVLLFQADGGAMLSKLAKHVRPGGLIIFHEPDWSFVRSDPPAPLYDLSCRRIVETFRLAKTDTNMASKLYRLFLDAGLPPPVMMMQALIAGAAAASNWIEAVAELTTTLLPTMLRLGVIEQNVLLEIDGLREKIHSQVLAYNSVVVGRAEIGAWSRL
jgi:ubiquinone/menaquinone biosynthesis C-methylase UbiE